jgi:hypothetical protein
MKSAKRGKSISRAEVANVSQHGFWLLVDGRELFLAFEHFPWFRDASVSALFAVVLAGPGHVHWPELDVDLTLESIEHPERFPLVSRVRERAPTWRRGKKPKGS